MVQRQAKLMYLDRTLIVRHDDPSQMDQLEGYTLRPSPSWSDPSAPLVKLTTIGGDTSEHNGFLPSFDLRKITLECNWMCSGLLLDRVLGSSFYGMTITKALGSALMMSRTKETKFYSLTITNSVSTGDQPLVDFGYSVPNPGGGQIDGNNNLAFYGPRLNYNDHRVYIGLRSAPHTSANRAISVLDAQIHVLKYPVVGTPESFVVDRERCLVEAYGLVDHVMFYRCNFVPYRGWSDNNHPRIRFIDCRGRLPMASAQ